MKKIRETLIREYQAEEYDVVVAGGGIAGISAALAAARGGARVLLLERQFALGGLATLGLVTIYLPLCDGMGNQVSFGISEELLRLSIRYGAEARYPDAWLAGNDLEKRRKQRFEVQYNASLLAILAEDLLLSEGVKILYGSVACAAQVEDGRITALMLENKSGRSAVCPGAVVDATGDADICALAGEETALFQPGNPLAAWHYYLENGQNRLKMLGFADLPDREKSGEAAKDLTCRRYGGLDAWELSQMTIDAHRSLLREYLREVPGGAAPALTGMAAIPQVRMTRRLNGLAVPDALPEAHYADSIGVIGNWRRPGPSYELPFGCLHGRRIKNLLAAGRCISATEAMWDLTRVIPACAVTGEAAGTAASLGHDFDAMDRSRLQERLQSNGVRLFKERVALGTK